jgi:hypothetical protein
MGRASMTETEARFYIKSPDLAEPFFKAFKQHAGSKQMRGASFLEHGEYFTLAVDLKTMQARIVPLKEL